MNTQKLIQALRRLAQEIRATDEIPEDLEPGALEYLLREAADEIERKELR